MLQDRLDKTVAQLTDSKRLNIRLEEDLAKLQSDPFSSSHSVAPSRYAPSHAGQSYRTGRISPTSSIISGIIPHAHSTENLSGSGSAILPMITAQRDRFKQKNAELENDLAKAQSQISSLKQEVANLQRDNMQLYEKTRYVSSYNRTTTAQSSTSSFSTNPNPSSVQIDRYRAAYEQNISPFQAFRGRETARAMKKMGLAERVVYGLTRVILANRMTRNLFVGYCLFLHFLVILTLYYSGSARLADTPGIVGDMGKAGDGPGDWREEPYPGGR
jgi:homeobox protein cut-like